MGNFIDLTGNRYGRLVVISRAENQVSAKGNVKTMWLCKCDCGNTKIVSANELRKVNGTRSCGCYRSEYVSTFNRQTKTIHGDRYTHLYREWISMRHRCRDKKNIYYGKKGITVCDEWNNPKDGYINFKHWSLLNGYADNLTIDRIDYNGNYEPNNCRWVSSKDQANNRITNRHIVFNGEDLTISQFSDKIGIIPSTIIYKLNRGISPEEIASNGIRKGIPTFEFENNTYNMYEWGIATGYEYTTIYNRMRNLWSPYDIIMVPPKGRFLNCIYFVDCLNKPIRNQMMEVVYFEDSNTGEKINQNDVN